MSFIFHFGKGDIIDSSDPKILGNKGANLVKMANMGFNIPEGFIISSQLCQYYYSNNKTLPPEFDQNLLQAIKILEQKGGKVFGCSRNPLLVSVRSGASVSMPGMMDTILNVGLNDQTTKAIAVKSGEKFALDSYLRFLHMFAASALNIPKYLFANHTNLSARDLDLENLRSQVAVIKEMSNNKCNISDVYEQIRLSILAVLNSWTFEKAITYRQIYNIPESFGTAIVIQSMVFGNINQNSGTGVVFSRNPSNGDKELYGEFLLNAQGEEVVSGNCNPVIISDLKHPDGLRQRLPKLYDQLCQVVDKLEQKFCDMQDVEFTIEDNQLYILQTRSGKRSVLGGVKIAVDMANEGLISRKKAIGMIVPEDLNQLMHMFVDYNKPVDIIGKGLGASPGSACGIMAFSSDEAEAMSPHTPVILVRPDTNPEDIKGMHHASGILTSRGGMTSHAAVVARGMGKPCICGAPIIIDQQNKTLKVGDVLITQDQYITIDGSSGNIIMGQTELVSQYLPKEFDVFMSWVDEFRSMKVRANAENPLDIKAALKFGAEGIGLCRTEHMLFEKHRLALIRKIIITDTYAQKIALIDQLFELHKQDFKEIFALISNLPVNIRLFDPPLHEFLAFDDIEQIAQSLEIDISVLERKLQDIHEKNPMLGHRGCRLGITMPELYMMQLRAILEAALESSSADEQNFELEIMLPFIADKKELEILLGQIKSSALKVERAYGRVVKYKIGIMIELPRAALLADTLAPMVDYFSFGTNDLTQMTYGLSRDDMASFAGAYKDQAIFDKNPFVTIDKEGVGQLIQMACEKGRAVNKNLSLSVCGEHGGDPSSIEFFSSIGLTYVSCSPFRIIIAKLAAAQANL